MPLGNAQTPQSTLDQYMSTYGQRLNKMLGLATPPSQVNGMGQGSFEDDAGGTFDQLPIEPTDGMGGEGPYVNDGSDQGDGEDTPPQNLGAPMQGGGAPAQPQSLGAAPAAAQPTAAAQDDGPSPFADAEKTKDGKIKVQTMPSKDFDFGLKDKDLDGVKTMSDLVDKLPKKKANEYMDWWEEKYGSINDKFDQLKSELGPEPQEDDDLHPKTRKDKFKMLMEFGINMIKHSRDSQNTGQDTAAAMADTITGRQEKNLRLQKEHRNLSDKLEERRQAELHSIGTRGDAMRSQAQIDADETTQAKNLHDIESDDTELKNIIYSDDGTAYGVTKTGDAKALTDQSGKPIKSTLGVGRGSRGGRGGSGGYAPSDPEKRATFYSKTYNIPVDVALDIVRQEKTAADPFKMYQNIAGRLIGQFYDKEEAQAVAKEITEGAFGAGVLDGGPNGPLATTPAPRPRNLGARGGGFTPPSPGGLSSTTTPPANLLKQGVVRTIRNKQTGAQEKWTLDENGQPKRVLR